ILRRLQLSTLFSYTTLFRSLAAGVDQIIRVLDGENLPPPARNGSNARDRGIGQAWPVIFIVALVMGGLARQTLGRLPGAAVVGRSEEHTSELQSHLNLVRRL